MPAQLFVGSAVDYQVVPQNCFDGFIAVVLELKGIQEERGVSILYARCLSWRIEAGRAGSGRPSRIFRYR